MKRIYPTLPLRFTAFVLLATAFSFAATQSFAEPWVNSGDERTRHHLQVLSDSSKLNLPLTTWPIMWSGIKRGLDHIHVESLNEAELWSYRYLRHHLERAMRNTGSTIRIKGSSLPTNALSGFSDDTREGSEASVSLNLSGENYALKVSNSYINDPVTGNSNRLDGSYFAYTYKNWAFGVGKIDRWWGPGWQGSALLTQSARPVSSVFFQRKDTAAKSFDSFGWLGSWDLTAFLGELSDKRSNIDDPRLAGARFTFKPFHFAEFGISRTRMSGGNVLPNTNLSEEYLDSSYQLTAFDWRVGKSLSNFQLGLYQQLARKNSDATSSTDEASILGMEMGLTVLGLNSRLSLERQSTTNNASSIFDDPLFSNGYRYHGKPIATAIDSAAKTITLRLDHYFDTGQQFSWQLGKASLNDDNIALEPPAGPIYGKNAIELDYASITFKTPVSDLTQLEAGFQYFGEPLTFIDETIETGGYLQLTFAL